MFRGLGVRKVGAAITSVVMGVTLLSTVPAQAAQPAAVSAATPSLWGGVPMEVDPDRSPVDDNSNVANVEVELDAATERDQTVPREKQRPPTTPTNPGGTIGPVGPAREEVVQEDEIFNGEIWFYEDGYLVIPWVDGQGAWSRTYTDLYNRKCAQLGLASADKSLPFDGNAIPIPQTTTATPERRAVAVSVRAVKRTVNNVQDFEEQWYDPKTGSYNTTPVQSGIDEWFQIDYFYKCKTQEAPKLNPHSCATYVKVSLDGPFNQKMQPMTSIELGGSNTRIPRPKEAPNVIGWQGEVNEEASQYGKKMEAEGISPTSGTPTINDSFDHCVPTEKDSFGKIKSDSTNSLGRYVVNNTTWYSVTTFYQISTPRSDKVFPALVDTSKPNVRNIGGPFFYLKDIGPATPDPHYAYFSLVCSTGTSPGGLVTSRTIAGYSKRSWDNVNWGDSNPEYYDWNCGEAPATPNEIRTNDFLQCDTYGQRATAPYQYDRLDYTYSSGTRDVYGWKTETQFRDRGADYINGQWIGRPCPPGWYDAGHNCAQDRQVWGVVGQESYSVKNPTPAGYSDNGSYWYRKAAPPAGWIDNGTEYETTTYSNIIVDNKNAAPIRSANAIVNGEVQPLEYKNGVYRIGSAADPVHVNWEKPLILTRGGKDVNVAGKNQVWEFKFELAPWSSPRLKNAPVNEFDQPYHGWVDEVGAAAAANIPVDRKWEPDKYYENLTMPYTYKYLDYTYTKNFEYAPYQYHQEACWGPGCPGSQYVDFGTDWSGTTCPNGGTMHDGKCLGWTQGGPITVKNAPPAGFYDDGRQYVKETQVKNPPPAGWEDTGINYRQKNPAPPGYTDSGSEYISIDKVNRSGKMGGIAFDKWMTWPSTPDDPLLKDCTVNQADYASGGSKTFTIRCGDNVTPRTHAAYFRYFQATTAGQRGWQVTPWWRVTVDIQSDFTALGPIQPLPNGRVEWQGESTTGKWLRERYECPGEPFLINIERIATN